MKKTLDIYRDYSAQDLKDRASIPLAGDIIVNSSGIDCANITTTLIRGVLGAAVNRVADLARHANVNPWSAFGPTARSVSGGILTNSIPTIGGMDDFAGYNHNAAAPDFVSGGVNEEIDIVPDEEVVLDVVADIGEILYTDISGREGDALGVAFSVWDGSTLLDARVKALAAIKNIADFSTLSADRITISGISSSKDLACKIEIIDSADTYDYSGSHIICQLAELPDWIVTVNVSEANFVYLSADPHWSFEGTPENFNSYGHIIWEALTHQDPPGTYTNVAHFAVTVWVEQLIGGLWTKVTCDHELYHSGPENTIEMINYFAWETAEGAEDLDLGLLASGYGYRCVVFVNEHPV